MIEVSILQYKCIGNYKMQQLTQRRSERPEVSDTHLYIHITATSPLEYEVPMLCICNSWYIHDLYTVTSSKLREWREDGVCKHIVLYVGKEASGGRTCIIFSIRVCFELLYTL